MAPDLSALQTAVADALANARARWPRLRIDDEVFLPYLQARLPGDDAAAVGSVHVEDLYVACGCVLGDPEAVACFDASHGAAIRAHVTRVDTTAVQDVCQGILTRLLVGDGDEPPRLASFAGRSPLAAWLRVVATRDALMHRRRVPDPGAAPEAPLADFVDTDEDPELAVMRARHREDFRRAFEEALTDLAAGDRALLRSQLVDRLTIDDLASIHGVHRATAARRLAKIREHLLRDTRRNLTVALNLPRAELESLFRLVRSQLEVSVRRLLDA